jgi:hypothetical protein
MDMHIVSAMAGVSGGNLELRSCMNATELAHVVSGPRNQATRLPSIVSCKAKGSRTC